MTNLTDKQRAALEALFKVCVEHDIKFAAPNKITICAIVDERYFDLTEVKEFLEQETE